MAHSNGAGTDRNSAIMTSSATAAGPQQSLTTPYNEHEDFMAFGLIDLEPTATHHPFTTPHEEHENSTLAGLVNPALAATQQLSTYPQDELDDFTQFELSSAAPTSVTTIHQPQFTSSFAQQTVGDQGPPQVLPSPSHHDKPMHAIINHPGRLGEVSGKPVLFFPLEWFTIDTQTGRLSLIQQLEAVPGVPVGHRESLYLAKHGEAAGASQQRSDVAEYNHTGPAGLQPSTSTPPPPLDVMSTSELASLRAAAQAVTASPITAYLTAQDVNNTPLEYPPASLCVKLDLLSDDWQIVAQRTLQAAQDFFDAIQAQYDQDPAALKKTTAAVAKLPEYLKKQDEASISLNKKLKSAVKLSIAVRNCIKLAKLTIAIHEVGVPQDDNNVVMGIICSERVEAVRNAITSNKRIAIDVVEGNILEKIASNPARAVDKKFEWMRNNKGRAAKRLAERAALESLAAGSHLTNTGHQDTKPKSKRTARLKKPSMASGEFPSEFGVPLSPAMTSATTTTPTRPTTTFSLAATNPYLNIFSPGSAANSFSWPQSASTRPTTAFSQAAANPYSNIFSPGAATNKFSPPQSAAFNFSPAPFTATSAMSNDLAASATASPISFDLPHVATTNFCPVPPMATSAASPSEGDRFASLPKRKANEVDENEPIGGQAPPVKQAKTSNETFIDFDPFVDFDLGRTQESYGDLFDFTNTSGYDQEGWGYGGWLED